MTTPATSPIQKLSRRQQVEKDIERCKNAKVICVNEPNPNLMRILAAEIIDSNVRRLEMKEVRE